MPSLQCFTFFYLPISESRLVARERDIFPSVVWFVFYSCLCIYYSALFYLLFDSLHHALRNKHETVPIQFYPSERA